MTAGYIHSIESCGTVDGPGIRYVVFLQGCPLRCAYCHNPDTWDASSGTQMSVDEVLEKFYSNLAFYRTGGVTVTGGEPMMQMDFLIELFTNLKQHGIHTTLDTSGIVYQARNNEMIEKFEQLFRVTDLVLLDIKHIRSDLHKDLTGFNNDAILAFARYLDRKGVPVWIRHVVVPGITLFREYLEELGIFIGTLDNVKAIDVLPYHSLGQMKYEELNVEYTLAGMNDATNEEAAAAKDIILSAYKQEKIRRRYE